MGRSPCLEDVSSLYPWHDKWTHVFSKAPISLLLNFCINGTCFPGGALVKNPPANAVDARDAGSIPGSERSSGVGNGNLLQYSCLRNSMCRVTWWAPVPEVSKSCTQPSYWAQHRVTWAHVPWSCDCLDNIPFSGYINSGSMTNKENRARNLASQTEALYSKTLFIWPQWLLNIFVKQWQLSHEGNVHPHSIYWSKAGPQQSP